MAIFIPVSTVIEYVNSDYLNLSSENIYFNFRNSCSICIVESELLLFFQNTVKYIQLESLRILAICIHCVLWHYTVE